jgi:hypothetical protein
VGARRELGRHAGALQGRQVGLGQRVGKTGQRVGKTGQRSRPAPLSNSRSLRSVSNALRIALLALNTSSMKAMVACGRKPAVMRS